MNAYMTNQTLKKINCESALCWCYSKNEIKTIRKDCLPKIKSVL